MWTGTRNAVLMKTRTTDYFWKRQINNNIIIIIIIITIITVVDLHFLDPAMKYEIEMGIKAYPKVNVKYFNPLVYDSIIKIALF